MYDIKSYKNYLRVTPEIFQELLNLISPKISKLFWIRQPISSKIRLQIVLRYLATGNSMHSMAYEFRVGVATICQIISETCDAIWDVLSSIVFVKDEPNEWKNIADGFYKMWNFPNCIGAMDGRHMVMQAPANSGSLYFNYKKSHSVVLLGICDAYCKFILVDIGSPGRKSDGGIFRSSEMGYRFFNKQINLPEPSRVGEKGPVLPYYLVSDEGFPLADFNMRPYAKRSNLTIRQKIFNYRLSRARRIIECTFGILVSRFRIFRRPILASCSTVIKIIKAAVCLHNFILDHLPPNLSDKNVISHLRNDSYANGFTSLNDDNEKEYFIENFNKIRNDLAEYFMREDSVQWQWQKIRKAEY